MQKDSGRKGGGRRVREVSFVRGTFEIVES